MPKCVFNPKQECNVRKEMQRRLTTTRKKDKMLKPLNASNELQTAFAPIFDKMQEAMQQEFAVLHFYCQMCEQGCVGSD